MNRTLYIFFAVCFLTLTGLIIWTNRDAKLEPKKGEGSMGKLSTVVEEDITKRKRDAHNNRPFYFSSTTIEPHFLALKVSSINVDLGNHGATNEVIDNTMAKLKYSRSVDKNNEGVLIYQKLGKWFEQKREDYVLFNANKEDSESVAVLLNLAEWIAWRDTEINFVFLFGDKELSIAKPKLVIRLHNINGSLVGEFSRTSTQKLVKGLAKNTGTELETFLTGEKKIDWIEFRGQNPDNKPNFDKMAQLTFLLSNVCRIYD